MTTVTYEKVKQVHGDNADAVAAEICGIHKGLGLTDFLTHTSGIDISGCSEADQAKIKGLLTKKNDKKEAV